MSSVERLILVSTRTVAVATIALFVSVVAYIAWQAVGGFTLSLVQPGGSLWAPMLGTLILVILALLLAFPVGVAGGVYLGVYADGRSRRWLSFWFELLASIPSILVGLFGFALILLLHRWWSGALPSLGLSAISLAILILPYLIKATELGIIEAPHDSVSLAYAMGAHTDQVIWHIWLPAARSHIVKGAMLAFARAAEDTAVILLTGAVASYGIPSSVWEPYEALPFFIYTTTAEYGSQAELGAVFVAAAMLVSLAGVIVLSVKTKKQNKVPK